MTLLTRLYSYRECFTQHDDEEGSATQLELYADYQRLQQARCGGIVLLTHHTDAPAGWTEPVVTWSAIHRWLSRRLPELVSGAGGPVAVLNYWTQQLVAFIAENGMSGTRIALSDIIALPAFERLRTGMRGLGTLARRELPRQAGGQGWRGLGVPGYTFGSFNEPQFFGVIMTPEGVKADDAAVVLWCGVLASKACEIAPHTQGIPELSVGLGAWTEFTKNDSRALELTIQLPELFASSAPEMNWSVDWKPRESNAIAVAAVHRIDYLLTWNCRHIDNATKKPIIRAICSRLGYSCPEICTPMELLTEGDDDVPR